MRLGPFQRSMMKKKAKNSIVDVWKGLKYTFVVLYDKVSDVYLEPSRTSTMDLFY